ncbi:MAG: tRNA pseudouridine(38-40) synthase TruA [Malacoplasma sp.]|nr:tRNA pseudouridine(38-40) synthase TruA [Malacoplasma sp.]
MTYILKISYDGSFFSGYAKQTGNIVTVQSELEKYLSLLFNSSIKTVASGRTDKYVHAFDQTVSFSTKIQIKCNDVKKYLNDKLNNIYVKNVSLTENSFNARFSIKSKTYLYLINIGEFNLFRKNYEYQYNKFLDIKRVKDILNLFVGTKDFLSFSTSSLENTVRTIRWIKIYKVKKRIFIFINGLGFLRNMVRMIVATLIKYCEQKIIYDDVITLFSNPKKGSSVDKAPGCGLYLYKTNY